MTEISITVGVASECTAFDPGVDELGEDVPVPEDDWEGNGNSGMVAEDSDGEVDELELATFDASCANPTDTGFWRKTEYTFFKNVSPTTQFGVPAYASVPMEISNMAPRHIELPSSTGPRFMSSELMGHV